MGKAKRTRRPAPENLTPFLEPLRAVQHLLSTFGGRGVIIGGIAVSLLSRPRYTADVDAVLLLELDELPHLLEEAAAQGLEARIPDIGSFARKNRVLLLRHTASGIDIDISLGLLPFESEMVERSQWVKVAGLRLRLPTPEDLIILKAVAHRTKDLSDIEAIVADHTDLDKERIRHWVSLFADALDMPELWDDLESRLR